eukprot:scaffold66739_cov32-Tisochrysis_lutea.AAC.6
MRQPRTPPSRGRGSVAVEGLRSRSTKVIPSQQENSDGGTEIRLGLLWLLSAPSQFSILQFHF